MMFRLCSSDDLELMFRYFFTERFPSFIFELFIDSPGQARHQTTQLDKEMTN